MARVGRSRKAGRRERSGRPQRPEPQEAEAAILSVALAQPHRAWLGDKGRDQRAENELGRLRMLGEMTRGAAQGISSRQYQAGLGWRRTVLLMRWAIDAPLDRPAAINLTARRGHARLLTPDEADEHRASYADAYRALAGAFTPLEARMVMKEVNAVVIHDRGCSDLARLKLGLNVLSQHFRQTAKDRSAHAGNAG